MTSHAEYIADQSVDQLNHLIEVATKRRDDLRHGGWVSVWVVADYSRQGWFAKVDYAGAVALLAKLANKHLAAGKTYELTLEEVEYRPAEAQRLIEETQAKIVASASAAVAAQPVGVCQAVSVTDERAAFEAWAKENCCAAGGINFKRFDVGGGDEIYDDPSVETSYQAYLAGARQQPASTQPTDEAVAWMTQGTDGPIFYTVKPVNGLERFTPLYPASAQPVAVPEGWQLVPKEPTRAMLDAAHTNFRKDIEIDPLLKTSYRAMLSAAQKQEGV